MEYPLREPSTRGTVAVATAVREVLMLLHCCTYVYSTVVFCRFRISRLAVPGTRHDTTRVSTSTPNENVDHEELQLVLDGCWRRLGNTWVVRVVVLWCCGIPRCFEVQKGFLGVCMQEISRKGCSPLLFLNLWPRIWLFRAPVRNSLISDNIR